MFLIYFAAPKVHALRQCRLVPQNGGFALGIYSVKLFVISTKTRMSRWTRDPEVGASEEPLKAFIPNWNCDFIIHFQTEPLVPESGDRNGS